MRRMFLIAVASCTLLAVAPATALARHHSRRHHHTRTHHRTFGHDPASTSTTTTPTPTATVGTFTNGVLTITTASGSVSGTVTPDTRLVCIPSQPSGTMEPTGGDQWRHHDGFGDQGFGDHGFGGGDQGQGDESNQMCSTSDLVAGTPVQFADLSISSGGTNWDVVVLVEPPSTAPSVPDTDGDGD